ncbi:hypothetical protein [Burkholderia cepacia]|uniref:hypothetical protein n=1 Tax=Burkholderia cepacia TaxID=292 RepID=UPI001591F5ED|nr:hypothetical protein [Burkholderia cepacia]
MSPPKLLWLCGHLFRRIELQHRARSFRILLVQPFVIVKRKSPDFSGLFLFLLGGASRSRTGLNGFAGRHKCYQINYLMKFTTRFDRLSVRFPTPKPSGNDLMQSTEVSDVWSGSALKRSIDHPIAEVVGIKQLNKIVSDQSRMLTA